MQTVVSVIADFKGTNEHFKKYLERMKKQDKPVGNFKDYLAVAVKKAK